MKLFKLSSTVLVYMLLTIGCDSEDKLVVKQYEIINSETNHSYKKSVDVRILKKHTKDELAGFAHEIKNLDSRKYDRIFIFYYLPGMSIGSGAYATTHYNPNLQIKILQPD
ncbi:MAG: hypothetical protein PF630_06625 [Gammaproteobacteria bacterium]|jgi:hypothetical protein|nr:hypothetical protein [Gammaproteobacteria bacterium]